jgi:uncharacterized Fe-S cluster-containing radical SAM superfamily enzyme
MGKVKPRAAHDAPFKVGDVVEYAVALVTETKGRTRAGTRGTVVQVYPESGRVRVALEDGRTTPLRADNLRKAEGREP